jgi:hypothetical protein
MDLIVAAAFGLQARAQFFGAQFCCAQFSHALLRPLDRCTWARE